MEPETRTLSSRVWLDGNPIFSLTYINSSGKPVYTDLSGYRPDPADFLKVRTKYNSKLTFQIERDYRGEDQWVLRTVEVDLTKSKGYNISPAQKFVYIR